MCKSEKDIPIWLDIKTEYIDENFEKVLNYLANGNKNDAFYRTTVELLGKRVDEYQKALRQRPVNFSESSNYDIQRIKFETRLIAASIMVDREPDSTRRKILYMLFLHSLSLIVPIELSGDLLELMISNIIYKDEPRLLFGWEDILNFEPQILAHKIINGDVFPNPTFADISFEGKGNLIIHEGSLCIAAMSQENLKLKSTQLTTSFNVIDDRLRLLTTKNAKLKQSDENDIESLEKYIKEFILEQSKVMKPKEKLKKTYSNGDALYMVVTACTFGKVLVRSVDPEFETVEGSLDFSNQIYPTYYADDFYKSLSVGQTIDATMTDYRKSLFSLKEGFTAHMIENVAVPYFEDDTKLLARVMKANEDSRGIMMLDWFTQDGLPIHTLYDDSYSPGDFGYIKIVSISEGKFYGFVMGEIVGRTLESFDYVQAKKMAIKGFDFPEDEDDVTTAISLLDPQSIHTLLDMMIRYQKTISKPTERFKVLCMTKSVAALVGASDYQDYIGFDMDYLKQLVLFAKGDVERMEMLHPEGKTAELDIVKQRCDIVRILQAYDDKNSSGLLESIIGDNSDESLTKIARLIRSCNIMGDVLPAATKNIIKREIARCLSLETEDEMDLDDENGIYLGIEDQHQEFKTSFVYPPDNDMQPNSSIQEKNIFKALCGFLNTEDGGTLYIGITDLGYVWGVENDMRYLNMSEMDTYTRFIQDRALSQFGGVDIIKHFIIKPVYDNRVVAIRVEPYEDGIVELNGKAYIRINNETREMNDKLRKLIREKKNAAREKTCSR